MDDAAVDGEERRDRFHRAGRAQQMADHRLGAADRHVVGVLAERELQRFRLAGIVELRRGAMRIHVVDVFRFEAGIFERVGDGPSRCLTGLIRRDLVERVVGGRVTKYLAVDARASIDRMLA